MFYLHIFTFEIYQLYFASFIEDNSWRRNPIEMEEKVGNQLLEVDLNTVHPGYIRLGVFS